MLTRLRLKDWKSFSDQTIPFGRLTLLVGANASGKSNVLDAIRFLKGLAMGYPAGEALEGQGNSPESRWPGIRGGKQEAARAGQSAFAIDSDWKFGVHTLHSRVRCSVGRIPTLDVDEVSVNGITVQNVGTGGPKTVSLYALRYFGVHSFGLTGAEVDQMCDRLSGMLPLQIQPRLLGDYVPQDVDSIGSDGRMLSGVLWQLCQSPQLKQELVDWVSELAAPRVRALHFSETDRRDVLLLLEEEDGSRISVRSLSDGTLRFLGVIAALMSAPEGSTILMEEIEDGLHPTRVQVLVELLSQLTQRRNIQVIATTHSPLVLEALGQIAPDALREVVVCGRAPDQTGTLARALGQLSHFDEVLARKGIARLFTTEWLERAL